MAIAVDRKTRHSGQAAASNVVGTIPEWWARRARAAGLPSRWEDWRLAVPHPPIPLSAAPVEELGDARPTALGEAYVSALDSDTRLREGRHYTPELLAKVLWREIRKAGRGEG